MSGLTVKVTISLTLTPEPHSAGDVRFTDDAEAIPTAPAAPKGWNARAAAMKRQLGSLGLAGVLAYGLLNTAYYTVAFFTIWVYVAKVPRGNFSPC